MGHQCNSFSPYTNCLEIDPFRRRLAISPLNAISCLRAFLSLSLSTRLAASALIPFNMFPPQFCCLHHLHTEGLEFNSDLISSLFLPTPNICSTACHIWHEQVVPRCDLCTLLMMGNLPITGCVCRAWRLHCWSAASRGYMGGGGCLLHKVPGITTVFPWIKVDPCTLWRRVTSCPVITTKILFKTNERIQSTDSVEWVLPWNNYRNIYVSDVFHKFAKSCTQRAEKTDETSTLWKNSVAALNW